MSFSFLGLTLHLYGMILGIALTVGVMLAEKQAKKHQFDEALFWRVLIVLVLGGVLGARLWHVWTDWHLYSDRLWAIPQVWRGGLSIIGSFVGALIGMLFMRLFSGSAQSVRRFVGTVADLAVFGLPVAQAIGRVANFVNQELYGLPTQLPWGIAISPEYRVPQYTHFTNFHPLFAYEAIGMLLCAGVLWVLERRNTWQIGSGKYALLYTAWYGIFRGVLEFIRVEKSYFFNTSLGVNQVVLFGAGVAALFLLIRGAHKVHFPKTLMIVLALALSFSGCVGSTSILERPVLMATNSSDRELAGFTQLLLNMQDRAHTPLQILRKDDKEPLRITVELVNSSASITQGLSEREDVGSDGMLFIFHEVRRHTFWMKEMKFDLDMIWILDGEVLEITSNIPHPSEHVAQSSLPTYAPSVPINMVLEVPAGTAARWGLQPGDQITTE